MTFLLAIPFDPKNRLHKFKKDPMEIMFKAEQGPGLGTLRQILRLNLAST